MSLPDRTSSLVERILASRSVRRGRDRAMRERALAGHARAREMMQATAARWQQRRKELYERLQEITESHDAQRRQLAPLRAPQPQRPAASPPPAHSPQPPRPVATRKADPVHVKKGREIHRGKGGVKR